VLITPTLSGEERRRRTAAPGTSGPQARRATTGPRQRPEAGGSRQRLAAGPGSGKAPGAAGKAAAAGPRPGTVLAAGDAAGAGKRAAAGKARSGRAGRPAPVGPEPRAPGRLRRALAGLSFERLLPDDEEARQRRAARLRKAGMTVTGTVLAVVVIYAVFPVRTALDLRSSTERARERLEAFREENARLEQEARELREDERIEQEARELGLAFPGEEVYGVLPAPEAPASTGTTSTTRAGG